MLLMHKSSQKNNRLAVAACSTEKFVVIDFGFILEHPFQVG